MESSSGGHVLIESHEGVVLSPYHDDAEILTIGRGPISPIVTAGVTAGVCHFNTAIIQAAVNVLVKVLLISCSFGTRLRSLNQSSGRANNSNIHSHTLRTAS